MERRGIKRAPGSLEGRSLTAMIVKSLRRAERPIVLVIEPQKVNFDSAAGGGK